MDKISSDEVCKKFLRALLVLHTTHGGQAEIAWLCLTLAEQRRNAKKKSVSWYRTSIVMGNE